MPHDALDPVPVAAEIILALQSEVARRTPVTDPIVLSITRISAGTTHNVLPDASSCSARCVPCRPKRAPRGRAAFERICTHVAAAHDCTAEVRDRPGLSTDSQRPARRRAGRATSPATPSSNLAAPNMGGEDFSYVLEKVPGAMAFLGVAAPGVGPGDPRPAAQSAR